MWPAKCRSPFADVQCPAGVNCDAVHCIFSHGATDSVLAALPAQNGEPKEHAKRDDRSNERPSNGPITSHATANQVFTGLVAAQQAPPSKHMSFDYDHAAPSKSSMPKADVPRSATRPVSPPPKGVVPKSTASVSDQKVQLTPRKLAIDPAQFNRRLSFLLALFKSMSTLNDNLLKTSSDPTVQKLHLSENQLKKLAVDDEASIGEKHKAVYENVMRQRLVALKKMTKDEWIKERRGVTEQAKEKSDSKINNPKPVDTGLSPEEEVQFLSRLVTVQSGLDEYGYITRVHTQEEIDEAQRGVDTVDHWESCDRCRSRFQVFPNRREDGALTSGGVCCYHWGKKQWVAQDRGNFKQGDRKTVMSCCRDDIGSSGCTKYETHVFKISGGPRLSTIMPFVETPENDGVDPHLAICFDCEMGFTTCGMELLRLTAVSWPAHRPVLDILVRPIGHMLDVNTRFSGVTLEQFIGAKPFDLKNPSLEKQSLRIVESPYVARQLFLSLISPRTPLIGHALENDLNCIRVVHPNIVDTILLYPHPRGLPIRNSLKHLAERYLGVKIQMGGASGHDSFEDAHTTGELVRLRIAKEWSKLKDDGWHFKDTVLYPPIPGARPPPLPPVDELVPGHKRTHDQREEEGGRDTGSANETEGEARKRPR